MAVRTSAQLKTDHDAVVSALDGLVASPSAATSTLATAISTLLTNSRDSFTIEESSGGKRPAGAHGEYTGAVDELRKNIDDVLNASRNSSAVAQHVTGKAWSRIRRNLNQQSSAWVIFRTGSHTTDA